MTGPGGGSDGPAVSVHLLIVARSSSPANSVEILENSLFLFFIGVALPPDLGTTFTNSIKWKAAIWN